MTIDLTSLTTFKTQASAEALITLNDLSDLETLPEQLAHQPFVILGGGSNMLFADDYAGTVVVNRLRGRAVIEENDTSALVRLAAGEVWHDVVCDMSGHGFYGLENLALIPGTVGAAPVQNIGAYGVEVADFIESVEAFDIQTGSTRIFSAHDCQFSYRDSIFKHPDYRQRYIITAVTLRLSKTFAPVLSYQGLQSDSDKTEPLTAEKLLARVIAIRQSKLPDPDVVPNAGSFFKNAVVDRDVLAHLQRDYPDVPFFTVDETRVKIPTAWLLETAGFKGERRDSGAGVYEKHALILVNRGNAHGRDIYALACDMIDTVREQFSITISPEVRIIG